MKKHLFPLFLLFLGINIHAQQDFFAITGKDTPGINFNDFRAMDAVNATSGEKIFTAESSSKIFSQARKGSVAENKNSFNNSQAVTMAALAYDFSNNNLVYMPMFSSNIYVLNPQTKEITLVENNVARVSSCDINSHITRMTAGYDGNIYAVNNAGTQLLQMSKKGGQYVVNDLGIIKDDPSNGKNSFTAIETGFGGDMIADVDNNFYIFSASGNVFKVSVKDLSAKFVGKIAGIPDNYSVNGSAVNAQGKVVIASAKGAPLYEVDLKSLQAKQLPGEQNLHIYDLASKYFANDKKSSSSIITNLEIYPTKVDEHFINVHLSNKNVKGNLKLTIFDLSGKNVMNESLSVKDGSLDQKVYLRGLINGAYIVSIADESGKILLTKKILVAE
ncbi:T9SS C-terminal target domain-containing protein [Chryseobacterium joostei]|uniref:Por secretion system C-terminal sorting domain-containing protein n=1 Tax=Chryseobacterium joostei TaxID=112234 RepID=A0A1N7KA34_9FLAO|nr:T9SS type A sorting domain-containing protein [Chryseobacterium joostei]AZB01310.1 T9SS C-terminal target domain-containing protein [Chryseobacterium joostei]SIS58360.1 Por secretion system C-terminal sorting domain-containing protein [Chryseobacterium joostei]